MTNFRWLSRHGSAFGKRNQNPLKRCRVEKTRRSFLVFFLVLCVCSLQFATMRLPPSPGFRCILINPSSSFFLLFGSATIKRNEDNDFSYMCLRSAKEYDDRRASSRGTVQQAELLSGSRFWPLLSFNWVSSRFVGPKHLRNDRETPLPSPNTVHSLAQLVVLLLCGSSTCSVSEMRTITERVKRQVCVWTSGVLF